MSPQEQIDKKFILSSDVKHAVNLNTESSPNCWIFKREQNNDDWPWYSLRLALPQEIKSAQYQLSRLEMIIDIPVRQF